MKHVWRRALARVLRRPVAAQDLWVSIVINTLNRAASLERTLEGLARLDDDNFEVIVVAGPCTDNTVEMLARWPTPLRVGRCDQAILGVSRNIGLAMAAGDIVAFTDDDAVPRPDWLTLLRRGYADLDVGGVGGHVYDAVNHCIQWAGCTATRTGNVSVDAAPPYEDYQGPDANPFQYLCGCNMSYRRADLFAVGGFNDELRSVYDDAEIASRMHLADRQVVSNSAALVDHYMDASHIRDGKRVIRDPYNIMHDFTVFVMHCRKPGEPDTAAVAAATEHNGYWHYMGRLNREDGILTEAGYDEFCRRADDGLRDGLAAGAKPRRQHTFRPARKWSFRRFRS